ncbi:hypothetical protein GCM10011494_39680 [Novosphingobium endophyticum]|uniref:Uncharacterized protein n=1 Tax=Novosphingobium endophyticum TaxID=1955250 RepID=A0A916TYQ6_9SPHN|nr:hypothetical protein [Novosphingobium endophyticum]GGC16860.1 hypothetical protein GCM10011494_39680 [Novosphingobium endophyticum]
MKRSSGIGTQRAPTFASRSEAQAALAEFFGEIREEIATGQREVDNGYDPSEFRIVKAGAS